MTHRRLAGVLFPLLLAAAPGQAQADLYLPDYPDAPRSICAARYLGTDATCEITGIGEHFAVGLHGGGGVVRVVLEAPPMMPGLPPRVLASCESVATGGCVSAHSYGETPVEYGTALTCRAYGLMATSATFECANFDLDG